ncbi:unnamed protein product, partial [Mesorhabditis spiculigera]
MLAIDSLLTAARILEAANQHQTIAASTSLFLDTHIPDELELRDLVNQKMRVKRPMSNSSATSSEPYTISCKNSSTKQSRTAHNELEKNRRANLKDCLDTLKSLVPDSQDAAKNTTLALLTRAHDHIEKLDDELAEADHIIAQLEAKKLALLSKLSGAPQPVISSEAVMHPQYRPESTMSLPCSSRSSPLLETTFSSVAPSPAPQILDPVKEGLVSPFPLCYPSSSLYPHFDLSQHASILQELGLPLQHLIV